MKDLFEDYWDQQPEFAGGDGGPGMESCGKDTAQAAWTDGRGLLLLEVVIRVKAAHRVALNEVARTLPGSKERAVAADAANNLGKLLVTLSEMHT
jgi:hypothetical protein